LSLYPQFDANANVDETRFLSGNINTQGLHTTPRAYRSSWNYLNIFC